VVFVLAVAACAGALSAPVSCSAPSHPPGLPGGGTASGGSPGVGGGSGSGSPSLLGDGAVTAPTCNLGPEGGVCACVDQPLLGDPPNLFFVLDRSGSMNNAWNASGVSKWATVVSTITSLVVSLGPRANLGAAVFPDPHYANVTNCESNNPTGPCQECAPGLQVFPGVPGVQVLRGDTPAGTAGPVEAALASMLNHVGALGGTPTAATFSALAPTLKALPGKTYVIFATDGGPNCSSALTCTVSACTSNIENDPGCPPAGPNCCDPSTGGTSANCLDEAATVAAVHAIANAGIPVYVVGVPQSEPYSALLDELATAGGTARASEPLYYAASGGDPSALLAALKQIAAKITGTCTLTLDHAPPDPSLVNVFFDGSPLPMSGPDGWTLTTVPGDAGDAGGSTTVTVKGASCMKIQDGDVIDVRVVAGCPTVTQ
jgi:hypothetical protein